MYLGHQQAVKTRMMTRSILMICLLLWLILLVLLTMFLLCCWMKVRWLVVRCRQPPCLPSSARPRVKEAEGLSVAVTRQSGSGQCSAAQLVHQEDSTT